MSYEPTVWKDGDLVTSAKLNKLEQGVTNGGVHIVEKIETEEAVTLNEKAGELLTHCVSGVVLAVTGDSFMEMITMAEYKEGMGYGFFTSQFGDEPAYIALSTDDYPSRSYNNDLPSPTPNAN